MVKNLVEINCSVLGNYEMQEASALEEVIKTDEILSYADKYIGNGKGKLKDGMVSNNGSKECLPLIVFFRPVSIKKWNKQ